MFFFAGFFVLFITFLINFLVIEFIIREYKKVLEFKKAD